jgi:hypothetical protein
VTGSRVVPRVRKTRGLLMEPTAKARIYRRRFPPPLAIAPAVLLSWPGEEDGWTVESATSVDGPWAASDATPFKQDGRHSIVVPTDGERRFFRLR